MDTASTNVTYVSMLFSCTDDRVPIKQRVEWLKPLLDANLRLILFVDEIYANWLGPLKNVKVIVLENDDLATLRTMAASTPVSGSRWSAPRMRSASRPPRR